MSSKNQYPKVVYPNRMVLIIKDLLGLPFPNALVAAGDPRKSYWVSPNGTR